MTPLALLGMAFSALLTAVIIEWLGMALGLWALPGAQHARQTLITDLSYLNADFTQTFLGVSPVELSARCAQSVAVWMAYLADQLHLQTVCEQLLRWFQGLTGINPVAVVSSEPFGAQVLSAVTAYMDAAVYAGQTVAVRLVVAALTLPAYALIGLSALLDGLVARDLRKFTGANESAFAYHRFRPWVKRFFVAGWYCYIAWPGSIHPNVIFVPGAILCGWAMFNTAKWFKKFF